MSSPESVRPRVAPSPEGYEREPNLDVVVVIPCYDEWPGILRTLASIAGQKKKQKELLHGVVVVINNKPDAPEKVKAANAKTYTMLQLIRLGYPIDVVDEHTNYLIRSIQTMKLRIEVIDAFSEGHAHEESNVGRARKTGTQHALSLLKPQKEKAAIISTDGDSMFGSEVIESVHKIFSEGHADAVALGSALDTNFLDSESRRAYQRYRLQWELRDAYKRVEDMLVHYTNDTEGSIYPPHSRDSSILESELICMGGGYSAYTRGAYEKSGGYKDIGTAEDTELSHAIAEAGGIIKDIREKYPRAIVFTQPRISERTEKGYGHTIGEWDEQKDSFLDVRIPSYETTKTAYDFHQAIALLPEGSSKAKVLALCKYYHITGEKAEEIAELYSSWNGKANMREHFMLVQKINDYVIEQQGKISVGEYRTLLEGKNKELSDSVEQRTRSIFDSLGMKAFPEWKHMRTLSESLYDDFASRHPSENSGEAKELFLTYVAHLYYTAVENVFDVLQVAIRLFSEKRKLLKIKKQEFSFDMENMDGVTPETFTGYADALEKLTLSQKTKLAQVLIEARLVVTMLALSLVTQRFPHLFSQVQKEVGYGLLASAENHNNKAWDELLKEAGIQVTVKPGLGLFGEKP